ncbi:MAG: hypothetical protein K9H49_05750 [Bacteroidales bacterium]|nr:hypothetical protein [Bacteroidales bacterium]MCF8404388.1 hypothetical protein [Bacteroidales bacterium]
MKFVSGTVAYRWKPEAVALWSFVAIHLLMNEHLMMSFKLLNQIVNSKPSTKSNESIRKITAY